MFFIAVTKKKIKNRLWSTDAKELKYDSLICTIVTDGVLSKLVSTEGGFKLFESPLISSDYPEEIILSQVIFSSKERKLEILRPMISGRAIYYHINKNGEIFCSTHISMLRKAGIAIEENSGLLPEFFVYRYVIPPNTLYKNIRQVSAGGRLLVRFVGDSCQVEEYAGLNCLSVQENPVSDKTIADRILDTLNNSCSRLKPTNSRITVLMSGGLDSSILFKIFQKMFGVDTTYSTGYPFEIPENNMEKEYAVTAAKSFGVNHEYYEPSVNEFLFGILQAISVAEQPLHHLQSVLLQLLLKNQFPKDKAVVISGLGADGIFGSDFHSRLFTNVGVQNNWWTYLLSQYPFINLMNQLSQATGRGRRIIRRLTWNPACRIKLGNVNHPLWLLGKYGDEKWVCDYFGVSRTEIIQNRYNAIKPFSALSLFDIASYLSFAGSASVTEGIWAKLGEANQKILFYPFTDPKLMRLAFTIPWDLKLSEPKNILRKTARRVAVPEYIVSRPKCGWGIAAKRWGPRNSIFEPFVPIMAKVFDKNQIRLMQSEEENKAMTFWNILNYSIWKRLCIDNEPLELLEQELFESLSLSGKKDIVKSGKQLQPSAEKIFCD